MTWSCGVSGSESQSGEPGEGYDQQSIRYTGRNIPSRSFRMLQSMTGGADAAAGSQGTPTPYYGFCLINPSVCPSVRWPRMNQLDHNKKLSCRLENRASAACISFHRSASSMNLGFYLFLRYVCQICSTTDTHRRTHRLHSTLVWHVF